MFKAIKSIVLTLLTLLVVSCFALLFIGPYFQHSIGTSTQVVGTIESSGAAEVGGGGLHGRIAVIVFARLPDGSIIRLGVPGSEPVQVGSKILLNVQQENFGQPAYSIVKLYPPGSP
jgi:beta-lactam-binding protein with PASTA domain